MEFKNYFRLGFDVRNTQDLLCHVAIFDMKEKRKVTENFTFKTSAIESKTPVRALFKVYRLIKKFSLKFFIFWTSCHQICTKQRTNKCSISFPVILSSRLVYIQWVLQIRDSSFLEKIGQIREIWEFPYLPFLRSSAK